MPILIRRKARRAPPLDARKVGRLAGRMLEALGLEDAELSVLLTDDTYIEKLNTEHMHKGRPTDVLAFPLEEAKLFRQARARGVRPAVGALGDVVISLDTAAAQARGRQRDLYAEVRFLLAHGLLHLVGYDHATAPEKREMTKQTRWLVHQVR